MIILDHSNFRKLHILSYIEDFPGGSNGKASAYNAGDLGSIPGSGNVELSIVPLQINK